jgi:hypothetical protein
MTALPRVPAPANLDALKWRCIGPSRGGRVVAVAGDPTDPMVAYFGACAGGIWKTIDGGVYWRCVSDGFTTAAVGAIAVARSDANVIYAGTGETHYPARLSPTATASTNRAMPVAPGRMSVCSGRNMSAASASIRTIRRRLRRGARGHLRPQ